MKTFNASIDSILKLVSGQISKLTNLAICYVFSVSLYVPAYFSLRLEAVDSNGEFAYKLTDFGQSTVYKCYAAGTFLLETILGVCTLGYLNVLSAMRFREKMIRKGHLLRNRTDTKQKEVMYTKMILILTTVCFTTRLLDAVTGTFARTMALNIFEFSDETKYRMTLCYEISLTLLLAAHAFDNCLYLLMDPNLRRCTRELFCRPTTQTTIVSFFDVYQSLSNVLNSHQSSRRFCQCPWFHYWGLVQIRRLVQWPQWWVKGWALNAQSDRHSQRGLRPLHTQYKSFTRKIDGRNMFWK